MGTHRPNVSPDVTTVARTGPGISDWAIRWEHTPNDPAGDAQWSDPALWMPYEDVLAWLRERLVDVKGCVSVEEIRDLAGSVSPWISIDLLDDAARELDIAIVTADHPDGEQALYWLPPDGDINAVSKPFIFPPERDLSGVVYDEPRALPERPTDVDEDDWRAITSIQARRGDDIVIPDGVRADDYLYLLRHGITREVIEHAGVKSWERGYSLRWSGLDYPLPVPRKGQERLDEKTGKPIKVEWPSKVSLTLNFLVEGWTENALIVEGVKQHMAAASWAPEGWHVVGMSGCNGASKDEVDLSWASGMNVYVCLDADRKTNPLVKGAGEKLSRRLQDVGASVYMVDNRGTAKDGIDDVLARVELGGGDPSAYLDQLIADAQSVVGQRFAGHVFDVNDLGNLPVAVPLITDVIDVGSLAMLAGKFGTYKTFLALSWAAHLATGRSWANHAVPEAVPVIYVAAEGVTGIQKRMKAWQRNFGEIPPGMFTVVSRSVRLTEDGDLEWIRGHIKRTGAKLVVFDTLHRSSPGVEENSAKEMGVVIDRVASLRDETGCSVLLLHHTGHNGERARGSSVNEDDIDSSFVVKLNNGDEDRSMGNTRILEHRKRKDGELCEPTPLMLVPVLGTDSAYIDVSSLASVEGKRASRMEELRREAENMGIPPKTGSPTILATFRKNGVRITSHEAQELARIRKKQM